MRRIEDTTYTSEIRRVREETFGSIEALFEMITDEKIQSQDTSLDIDCLLEHCQVVVLHERRLESFLPHIRNTFFYTQDAEHEKEFIAFVLKIFVIARLLDYVRTELGLEPRYMVNAFSQTLHTGLSSKITEYKLQAIAYAEKILTAPTPIQTAAILGIVADENQQLES